LRCEQRLSVEFIGYIRSLVLEIQLECGDGTIVEDDVSFAVTSGTVVCVSILESSSSFWPVSQSNLIAGRIEILAVEGVNAANSGACVPKKFNQGMHERPTPLLLKTRENDCGFVSGERFISGGG